MICTASKCLWTNCSTEPATANCSMTPDILQIGQHLTWQLIWANLTSIDKKWNVPDAFSQLSWGAGASGGFSLHGTRSKTKTRELKADNDMPSIIFRRWLSEHGWPDLFAQGTPRNSYEYLFYWEEYEPWYFRVPYFQTCVKCQNH
jgi:hypothetical protein